MRLCCCPTQAYLAGLLESVERLKAENEALQRKAQELSESRNKLARKLVSMQRLERPKSSVPRHLATMSKEDLQVQSKDEQEAMRQAESVALDGLPFDDRPDDILELITEAEALMAPAPGAHRAGLASNPSPDATVAAAQKDLAAGSIRGSVAPAWDADQAAWDCWNAHQSRNARA